MNNELEKIRKRLTAVVIAAVIGGVGAAGVNAETAAFSDVEESHWAYGYVHELRELGITNGVGGNEFGLGRTVTRKEFTLFLNRLTEGAFLYPEADADPDSAISRGEMAVMVVKALGYDTLAQQMDNAESYYTDVTENKGYIEIARDFGIISEVSDRIFMPEANALREHAAKMIVNMYHALNSETELENAFYAISSYSQLSYIDAMNSVSFGWCRLFLNNGGVEVDTARSAANEYYIPPGYREAYDRADGKTKMLMAAVSNEDAKAIISDATFAREAIVALVDSVRSLTAPDGEVISFDGVVVDFEGFKGNALAESFNAFLHELRRELDKDGKLMYVAVHPKRDGGQAFFDGYDYKTIGELADLVILMAHDYDAKSMSEEEMASGFNFTPLAPIDEVYYALKAAAESIDVNKIALQISFGSAQWKTNESKIINSRPFTPSFSQIQDRVDSGASYYYSERYESPYITFYNSEDGTDNIVWFENERSVSAKIKLAKMFGVTKISFWRLGLFSDYSPN